MPAQSPVIHALTPHSTEVEQYGKFEVTLDLTAAYSNPYDYDDIRVSALFTAPDGRQKRVDGFFLQEYAFTDQEAGSIAAVGSGVFRVRFSPDQPGTWHYSISCENAAGAADFPPQVFLCKPLSGAVNRGFVRSDDSHYLHFDNGEQYIPVGENIGWQNGNPYLSYQRWLGKLLDNGGNFFRIWQCHWGLGIEWRNNGYPGLRRYKQDNAFFLDWLFDFCAGRGIYAMLCLQHHGQVSTQVNPNWSESPYNAANGGMCEHTWDFFTDGQARAHVRNRLRYVVARWGYARSIMAWELFNEVDWTDQYAQRKAGVAAWHLEMAAYLKQIDPYGHLVTTSFARDEYDPVVWASPDIDLTQTHYYVDAANIERPLRRGLQAYLDIFGKPTLNGEFGIGASGAGLSTLDPTGIHIHNGLWGSLLSGGLGSAMSWWWDTYIDPKDLYYHFAPLSAFAGIIPFRERDYKPASASVRGAPADLSLTPGGDWGVLADTAITIGPSGELLPSGATLGVFLYGAQWNTQYRRPPVFFVQFTEAGQFRVITGSAAGQDPKIAIWIDGVKVLEQNAQANTTYAVDVTTGPHAIRVDNTGTDWITISEYVFTGLGSAVDAFVLSSDDRREAAGWVLNNRYNHKYIKANGIPPVASGAVLAIPGVPDGNYQVRWYDCLNGTLAGTAGATAAADTLLLFLPNLQWDLAFIVDKQPLSAGETVSSSLPFEVYPNPFSGGDLHFSCTLDGSSSLTVSLLDAAGREVCGLYRALLPGGAHRLQLEISPSLPAGLYWVKTEAGERIGSRALAVVRP